MSESSVITLFPSIVMEDYDLKLAEMGKNYLIKKRFMVGKGIDLEFATDLIRMRRIVELGPKLLELDCEKLINKLNNLVK